MALPVWHRPRARRILAVALAAALVPAVLAADDAMQVVYDDGRVPERMALVRVSGDEGWFLRAGDVARLLRATQFWNATSRKIVLGVGKSRVVLTVDTRVAVVDGEPVMMRTSVRYDQGAVLVPLEFVLEVASQFTPRGFEWDPKEKRLSVGGVGYNVTRAAIESTGDRTTVTLHLTEPLLYHVDTATPGLVRLKLYGGRVDRRAVPVRESRGLVSGVRAEQSERDAFVSLDVSRSVRRLRVETSASPPRLAVVLERGRPGDDARAPGTVEIVEGGATFAIDRVCIDPGHGGADSGHEGAGGSLEKDLNLAIARVVRSRIEEALGLEVVMTRDDDRLLELVERTEIANASGCDLFVSIHCNGWFDPRAGGFESYFQATGKGGAARGDGGDEDADGVAAGFVAFVPWDSVQNEFTAESSTFAEYIQAEMASRLGIANRGVKQASFVVLQGARMPAVIVETAFLSNPTEERMLADPAFHDRVAEGVVASIRKMQDRYR
jgi:N-acetylmuramoyl-L-alanine amidase